MLTALWSRIATAFRRRASRTYGAGGYGTGSFGA